MAEGGALLRRYTGLNRYRGFESLSLRQFPLWRLRCTSITPITPASGRCCSGLASRSRWRSPSSRRFRSTAGSSRAARATPWFTPTITENAPDGTCARRPASRQPALELATMSNRVSRLIAALLLALTLPLQGLAAVTAGQCMSFGHHPENVQDNPGHDHGHAADAAGAHDHANGNEDGGGSAHCGPCTACCASASIAGPVGVSIPTSPSDINYVFVQLAPPGFQAERLDRPPLAL